MTDTTWAVGLQTCPRPGADPIRMLDRLAAAGWENPIVFGEPGTPQLPGHDQITWPTRAGDWAGWLSAVSYLRATRPQADFYAMFEDDIALCRNVRPYLDRWLSRLPDWGAISLYVPDIYHRRLGFRPILVEQGRRNGWMLWGAQALVFSRDSLTTLLRSDDAFNYRNRPEGRNNTNKDCVVGRWAAADQVNIYYHGPSLVQHLNLPSLISSVPHQAADFPGPDFDATTLNDPVIWPFDDNEIPHL